MGRRTWRCARAALAASVLVALLFSVAVSTVLSRLGISLLGTITGAAALSSVAAIAVAVAVS